jgi:hypothetical protein
MYVSGLLQSAALDIVTQPGGLNLGADAGQASPPPVE